MIKLQLASTLAAISAAALLQAQEPAPQPADQSASSPDTSAFKYSDQLRVSKLLQKEVQAPTGEAIGKVEDLVFDKQGKLTHAVITHGGTLGVGQKLTAVPWQVVSTKIAGDRIVIQQSQLKQAPSFEAKKWPNLISANWSQAHDQYWKQQSQSASPPMRSASAPESGSTPPPASQEMTQRETTQPETTQPQE